MRHGQTADNKKHLLQGRKNIPLSDEGIEQAMQAKADLDAEGIRFDRIYTSPYQRARHTAQLVADGGAGPAPVEDMRLREMCFGRYEGVRYEKGSYPDDNMRCFFEGSGQYVPQGEGAETFQMVGARVMDFLENEVRPLQSGLRAPHPRQQLP